MTIYNLDVLHSLSPGVCSHPCPLSQWRYLTIGSSATPFSSCPTSFPASGSFPMSWLFPSDGQSIGASVLVPPMNIQDWVPLGLTGLVSLLSKGLSRVFSSTTVRKHQFFGSQPSLWTNSQHLYMSICSSVSKESACSAGDPDSIPGLGRSPGEGNGNPLHPCLENLMDRGAWWAAVHGVTKSRARLSD